MPPPPIPPTFSFRAALAGREPDVLASLFASIDLGVMLTDLEHRTLMVNRRFCELFGVDGCQVVNLDVDEVRQAVRARISDLPHWEQNLKDIYAKPKASQVDVLKLKNPDCMLRRESHPVFDPEGEVIGRLWTFADQTAEARRQEHRTLLHRMSTLFDAEPARVYQGLVRTISSHYDSTCIVSLRQGDIMHFHAIASPVPGVEAMTQNTLDESYCQWCLAQNGPLIIQDARQDENYARVMPAQMGITRYMGVPICDAQGETVGTLCILDHRSDELLTEDDLHFMQLVAMRLTAELERETQIRHLERNLAEMQTQLIQSEKLAVTGQLAATIAHDVRNIVSAMRLDLEDTASPELLDHLDRFGVLCHRLLSYSRPKRLEIASLDLANVLRRTVDLFAKHAEIAGMELVLDVPANTPSVRAIEDRLESLFANLILNAIESTPAGGRLTISVDPPAGQTVRVTFSDTGPGFPEGIEERLRRPFASTRAEGFGLGLYSCGQIMKEIGGSIRLENAAPKGARVTLEFLVG